MAQNLKKQLSKKYKRISKALTVISLESISFKKLIILLFFVALTITLFGKNFDNSNSLIYPTGWHIDREGQFVISDSNYEHTSGNPSILLKATTAEGNNPNRECNSVSFPVKPGQHVIYTC